jgi:antitoxin component YwqK of YwqJK toxin-antitoxin module
LRKAINLSFIDIRVGKLIKFEVIYKKFIKFFPWGHKKSEVSKVDGLFHGKSCFWHENGVKKNEVTYQQGKRNGQSLSWHKNGQIKTKGNYIKGKKNGIHETWNEEGIKIKIYTFSNNDLEGEWSLMYDTGSIKVSGSYKNNLEHGIEKTWYANGQLAAERNYFHGKLCSIKVWKPNGLICRKSQIVNGNGVVTFYKENLSIEDFSLNYKDGYVT